jgi:Replication-relaxation
MREEAILLSMKRLGYISRSQIQKIHNLGSDRNAQKILASMKQYLCSFREGETVYYLNSEGRDRVDSKAVRKKTMQAKHFLMRNEVYIAFGMPATWRNEVKKGTKKTGAFICDAEFNFDGKTYFVEVDHQQKMSANRLKVEKYKRFRDASLVKNFELIWITTTEYRRQQLKKICQGIVHEVYTVTDFK